jgi:hypothetical protein
VAARGATRLALTLRNGGDLKAAITEFRFTRDAFGLLGAPESCQRAGVRLA